MTYFDFYNPISYNTPLNSFIFYYNTRNICIGPTYFFGGNNNTSIWNTNPFGCWNFFNPFQMQWNNFLFNNTNPFRNMNSIWMNRTYNFTGTPKAVQTEDNLPISRSAAYIPVKEDKAINKKTSSPYIQTAILKNAKKYLGYNEADGSSKKFSNSKEWCADFVTYVVKESYKEKGLPVPEGFGNHRVENIKQWGINNDKYLSISDKKNKADIIKNNVKIGDIMILRENGASHTGFVSKINEDGSFEAIEGNRYDKVDIGKYPADYADLSGFVQLS